MTPSEFKAAVEWEGGVNALINEYGIKIDELTGFPDHIIADIHTIADTGHALECVYAWLDTVSDEG